MQTNIGNLDQSLIVNFKNYSPIFKKSRHLKRIDLIGIYFPAQGIQRLQSGRSRWQYINWGPLGQRTCFVHVSTKSGTGSFVTKEKQLSENSLVKLK